MLQKSTFTFLKELKQHNNKPWLDANRLKYEEAKQDFAGLVSDLIKAIGKFDAGMASLLAKDCTFRLNRDIRFSKDKTPYKTNFGAGFNVGGKKALNAGYYLHIEPGKCFIGGGFWMPPAEILQKIRQEIDYNFADFKKIMAHKNFKNNFVKGIEKNDMLTRPPKGYGDDNPAIEYIKLKSFIVTKPLSDAEAASPLLVKNVATVFKAMQAFVQFLNEAIA
ncbi:MAG: DUF2461 domain-containing protein [Bacteroidetes bacterium]|nr:DUF2461 domain-containing protein [Bacteroidota bacterium]